MKFSGSQKASQGTSEVSARSVSSSSCSAELFLAAGSISSTPISSCGDDLSTTAHGQLLTVVLKAVRRPLFVADAEARVQLLNRQAEKLLQKRTPFFVEGSRLAANSHEMTIRLRAEIQEHATQCDPQGESVLFLGEEPGGRVCVRIAATGCQGDASSNLVVLSVHDPGSELNLDCCVLSAMYGLTRSEAVLLEMLANGHSLESAADQLCVSVHTVRTHIKRTFLKTGTSRQSELISCVLRAFCKKLGWLRTPATARVPRSGPMRRQRRSWYMDSGIGWGEGEDGGECEKGECKYATGSSRVIPPRNLGQDR